MKNNSHSMYPPENSDGSISSNWPSRRFDAVLSVFLAFMSVIVGGFGLYMLSKSWQSFPLVLIGILIWGISCVGLRRLTSPKNKE